MGFGHVKSAVSIFTSEVARAIIWLYVLPPTNDRTTCYSYSVVWQQFLRNRFHPQVFNGDLGGKLIKKKVQTHKGLHIMAC